jgi:hypothetical protein
MKFSSFATDLNLEESGVWVDLGDGARLKLARIGNPAYKKLMREKLKPYRTQAARAGISEDKFTEMTCDVLSKTVLIDWKGWEDDKGKEIPYSHKNAYDMLIGLKDFRAMVVDLADQQATFAIEAEEEAGND